MKKRFFNVNLTLVCPLGLVQLNLQREKLKEEKWLQQYVSTEASKSWAQYYFEEIERVLAKVSSLIMQEHARTYKEAESKSVEFFGSFTNTF